MSKFYDKKEIFDKALKIYMSGKVFVDFMQDSELFPLEIKLKRLKQNELRDNYSQILNELNSFTKIGLNIEYKSFEFKNIGSQKLPIAVDFASREDLLKFILKFDEFNEFTKFYKYIVLKYPSLKENILKKPFLILEYKNIWNKLLLVCDFFLKHSDANIYIRELSIEGIDTKFVEKYKKILDALLSVLLKSEQINKSVKTLSNYGFEKKYFLKYPKPIVRFRILDDMQRICGISDISVTIDEFKNLDLACRDVYIVENKITMLSFPSLKDSIVIFGNGYGVEVLRKVDWLHEKQIFYWGDIDSDGYAILSQVRGYFKNTISILMDKHTINIFKHFSIEVESAVYKELKNLTVDEKSVFDTIDKFRLEQERIDFSYVAKALISMSNRL